MPLYAGWPNAFTALAAYDQVYTACSVGVVVLQAAPPQLPRDPAFANAAQILPSQVESFAPQFAELSERDVLDDLWRRSDLRVRDRSLVTIAALTAAGEASLLAPRVRRGFAGGVRREDLAHALTHLAFYAGWGKATLALSEVSRTLP